MAEARQAHFAVLAKPWVNQDIEPCVDRPEINEVIRLRGPARVARVLVALHPGIDVSVAEAIAECLRRAPGARWEVTVHEEWPDPPEELRPWRGRLGRLSTDGGEGHVLIHVIRCDQHGPKAVWEFTWAARLPDGGGWRYVNGIRNDWPQALRELEGSTFSWVEPSCNVTWLAAEDAERIPHDDLDDYVE